MLEIQLTPGYESMNSFCAFSEQMDANSTGKRDKYLCSPKGAKGET